jgi:hypothetical protein
LFYNNRSNAMTTKMTPDEARKVTRPQPRAGDRCVFYSEMLHETVDSHGRWFLVRDYTGQEVTVVRHLRGVNDPAPEYDGPGEDDVEDHDADEGGKGWFECSRGYIVRALDGREFMVHVEEIDGWDRDLGQFYGPSGVWGSVE